MTTVLCPIVSAPYTCGLIHTCAIFFENIRLLHPPTCAITCQCPKTQGIFKLSVQKNTFTSNNEFNQCEIEPGFNLETLKANQSQNIELCDF